MRLLAVNLRLLKLLIPRVQNSLMAAPAGLGFCFWFGALAYAKPILKALGFAYGPGHVPHNERGLVAVAAFLFFFLPAYALGWVVNAIFCRYVLQWSRGQLRAAFLESKVPESWLMIRVGGANFDGYISEPASGTGGPYRVGTVLATTASLCCTIIFAGFFFFALRTHAYGPMWGFVGFVALGVFLGLYAGHYVFDQEGVTHRNFFGAFRMHWLDVSKIEKSNSNFVLIGGKKRFVIPMQSHWSGRDKAEAFALFANKMKYLGLVPYRSALAAYTWHRNVRIRVR